MQDLSSHVGIVSSSHDLLGDFKMIRFIIWSDSGAKSVKVVTTNVSGIRSTVDSVTMDYGFCSMSLLKPTILLMKKLLESCANC